MKNLDACGVDIVTYASFLKGKKNKSYWIWVLCKKSRQDYGEYDEVEEEGRRGCVKKKKSRGILVFSHLSYESKGIFVHSRAYESISSATSSH